MKKNKKGTAIIIALLFSIAYSILFKWIQTGKSPFTLETVIHFSIVFINFLILGGVAYTSFVRNSNKSIEQIKKNLLPSFLLLVLIALVVSLLVVSIGVYAFYLVRGLDTSNFMSQLFRVELTSALKQFSIWILIGSAIIFFIIWQKALEREQKLREENLRFKYQNLKSQVNPHFLFNSLNTLSEIVYDDAKKADNYTQKLSKIYRYLLENEEIDLIPLNEELDFVTNYFSLQKARDNGKIELKVEIDNTNGYMVIPVSLQLLVENALKHNSFSVETPLVIRISGDKKYIIVSNTIRRKNTLEKTLKSGLKNLGEGVKLILGKDLLISEENNNFVVKLPISQA